MPYVLAGNHLQEIFINNTSLRDKIQLSLPPFRPSNSAASAQRKANPDDQAASHWPNQKRWEAVEQWIGSIGFPTGQQQPKKNSITPDSMFGFEGNALYLAWLAPNRTQNSTQNSTVNSTLSPSATEQGPEQHPKQQPEQHPKQQQDQQQKPHPLSNTKV